MKWLIEKVDGTWVPRYRTSAKHRPKGDFQLVSGPEQLPQLVEVYTDQYGLKVRENQTAVDAHIAKLTDKADSKTLCEQAKKKLKTGLNIVNNATTLDEIKPVLREMLKVIAYLIYDMDERD